MRTLVLAVALMITIAGCGERPEPRSTTDAAPGAVVVDGLEDPRPNILLLVADDLGYSDLGSMGGEIATPNLDSLAAAGLTLTNVHAAASCSPTRAMLLSGVDHHRAGLGNMRELMPESQLGQPGYEGFLNDRIVTVAQLLKDSGYHTYMAGKWHLGGKPGRLPTDRGFAQSFAMLEGGGGHFDDSGLLPFSSSHYVSNGQPVTRPPGYSSDLYTDTLIQFIDSNSSDGKPFFLYAAYTAPHWPLQAPEADIERYASTYEEGWDVLRLRRLERMQALGLVNPDIGLPPRWTGIPAWESLDAMQQAVEARKMAVYAAMVDNLDQNIGRLLDHLSRSGQLANTVIVFMSDNGADAADLETRMPAGMSTLQLLAYRSWNALRYDNSLANRGHANSFFSYGLPWAQVSSTPLYLHKGVVSEGGTRVPMIISNGERTGTGSRSDALVSVMDIAPTILEIADVKHPGESYKGRAIHPIAGRSLMPLIESSQSRIREPSDALGMEFIGNGALISGDWKILQIHHPYGDDQWRLFNLSEDPRELHDLSADFPDRFSAMLEMYHAYSADVGVLELPAGYFDNW